MKINLIHQQLILYSFCTFIVLMSCVAPYQLTPEFQAAKESVRSIAMYPLYYSDKGKEQCLFGTIFSNTFFDSASMTPLNRPINFILPDSTLSLLKSGGLSVIANTDTIKIVKDSIAYFPIYKYPTKDVQLPISKYADAILVCDLKTYNEVTFGKAMAQGIATAILSLGTVAVMEKSVVNMEISLIETRTGKKLWIYKPYKEDSARKSLIEQRQSKSEFIIKGFKKYFPFSKNFQQR